MNIFDQTNKMDTCKKKYDFVLECVLLICGTKNLFTTNVLFKTPVRRSWYTAGIVVLSS